MEMKYAMVLFVEEGDAPGIVAMKWVSKDGNYAYFPNVKSDERKDKMLREEANPTDSWSVCRIRILKEYATFQQARLKLRIAEETSNLETDEEEGPRKKIARVLSLPGEESTDLCRSRQGVGVDKTKNNTKILYPPTTLFESPLEDSSVPSSAPSSIHDVTSTSTDKLLKKVLMVMGSIQETANENAVAIRALTKKLDAFIGQSSMGASESNGNTPMLTEVIDALPITNIADFGVLDRKINQNKDVRKKLLQVLCCVGGRDIKSTIQNMMKKVITDELATNFSYLGKRNDKKCFSDTELNKVLILAVHKIWPQHGIEEKVKESVSGWLIHAKFRLTQRISQTINTEPGAVDDHAINENTFQDLEGIISD